MNISKTDDCWFRKQQWCCPDPPELTDCRWAYGSGGNDCTNAVCSSTELEVDSATYGGPEGEGCYCRFNKTYTPLTRSAVDKKFRQGDGKLPLVALFSKQHLRHPLAAPTCVDWDFVQTTVILAAQYPGEVQSSPMVYIIWMREEKAITLLGCRTVSTWSSRQPYFLLSANFTRYLTPTKSFAVSSGLLLDGVLVPRLLNKGLGLGQIRRV